MTSSHERRGTFGFRLLLTFLGVLLTLLLVWLHGFVVRDLDRIEGPDFAPIEEQQVGREHLDHLAALARDQGELLRQIDRSRERQAIYERDTSSSRQTLEQLLEFHRLRVEKGQSPSEAEQLALAEAQTRFLDYQQRFQDANVEIERLSEQLDASQREERALEATLAPRREAAQDAFDDEWQRHRFRVATYKLAILLPLFVAAAWLAIARRRSAYRMLWVAWLVASSWTLGLVIHDHFPTQVFKYIALGTGILIVLVGMVLLIRRVAAPSSDVLLRQYREAYPRQRCPVCSDPIRRGALKRATWTRKGPSPVPASPEDIAEERERPYTCASCGTTLFERCTACGAMRHALLPHCEACGAEKAVGAAAARPA